MSTIQERLNNVLNWCVRDLKLYKREIDYTLSELENGNYDCVKERLERLIETIDEDIGTEG